MLKIYALEIGLKMTNLRLQPNRPGVHESNETSRYYFTDNPHADIALHPLNLITNWAVWWIISDYLQLKISHTAPDNEIWIEKLNNLKCKLYVWNEITCFAHHKVVCSTSLMASLIRSLGGLSKCFYQCLWLTVLSADVIGQYINRSGVA